MLIYGFSHSMAHHSRSRDLAFSREVNRQGQRNRAILFYPDNNIEILLCPACSISSNMSAKDRLLNAMI